MNYMYLIEPVSVIDYSVLVKVLSLFHVIDVAN